MVEALLAWTLSSGYNRTKFAVCYAALKCIKLSDSTYSLTYFWGKVNYHSNVRIALVEQTNALFVLVLISENKLGRVVGQDECVLADEQVRVGHDLRHLFLVTFKGFLNNQLIVLQFRTENTQKLGIVRQRQDNLIFSDFMRTNQSLDLDIY